MQQPELSEIKYDCKFFKGEVPCLPNKLRDKVCHTCDEYTPISKRILIIKLGALGDVIRSTPLVVKYRTLYPNCHITWVTLSPEILPKQHIDKIWKMGFEAVYALTHQKFDIAINLDKEIEACSLLRDVEAIEKYGFIWNNHHVDAATPQAKHKLITGFFDNHSKANTKSYLEEIFEICHLEFGHEHYLINTNETLIAKWKSLQDQASSKKIIGLNTGCGKRWATRLWPKEYWVELIQKLQKAGYYPVVLGGPDEDPLNQYYSSTTGAYYPGLYSLEEFMAIAANCDVIVSAVSMMMHIAVGLKRPLVLFNNIFNKHEFEMYGRGIIVEPSTGCECFYGNTCKRDNHCMNQMSVDSIFDAVVKMAAL